MSTVVYGQAKVTFQHTEKTEINHNAAMLQSSVIRESVWCADPLGAEFSMSPLNSFLSPLMFYFL